MSSAGYDVDCERAHSLTGYVYLFYRLKSEYAIATGDGVTA